MRAVTVGAVALLSLAETRVPSDAVGRWTLGKAYAGSQPVGLDSQQEKSITGATFSLSPSELTVCGKHIAVASVSVARLTSAEFLAKYNLAPNLIGFGDGVIEEVELNKFHATGACGDFNAPGTHMFISKHHAVAEIANAYFRLGR